MSNEHNNQAGARRPLDENALAHAINMMPWRTDELGPKLREFAAQLWLQFCSVQAAATAPAVPQGNDPAWTLAAKVREALDRKACPGYYMDVAVEAVVHNYAPAAPSQPVKRPQNCGTSFCSCIECVCEPEPVTLTDEEIDKVALEATGYDGFGTQPMNSHDLRNVVHRAIAALREKESNK